MNDFQRVIRAAIEQEGGVFSQPRLNRSCCCYRLGWLEHGFFTIWLWNKDACLEHSVYKHLCHRPGGNRFRVTITDKDLLDPNWSSKTVLKQAQAVMERIQHYIKLGVFHGGLPTD